MNLFSSQIKNQKLGHSYLLICQNPDFALQQVEKIIADLKITPADVYQLDQQEKIKISDVRELQRITNFKPHSSLYKLAIIKQAENLTGEAANALLKTLEEPPARSIIILIAPNKDALLSTITSRCQIVRLAMPSLISRDDLEQAEQELNDLHQLSIKERFLYAEDLSNKDNLMEILTVWLAFYRQKIVTDPQARYITKQIQTYQQILSSVNVNKRLLLENLLLII